MTPLYTIGYEGSDIDRLVATLKNIGVQVLADVRELPLSRKKGLSKNSLRDRLAREGIEYLHFKELGDPKPGRDAAKSGNILEFERVFLNHLASPSAQEALTNLLSVAVGRKTCMLCFERCASICHRSYIADEAVERGFEVLNLVADHPEQYLEDGISIPRYNSRKGLTAAE
ncbi:MAG: DUF488 family protein [Boseongicola sp.]|nr:MAG: DUF488 family protein [Boseongicola sp.]